MDFPESIGGFTVLPAKYGNEPEATHIIYARVHVGSKKKSNEGLPDGRTLFLVNVPPDATERELRLFLKPFGTLERIVWNYDNSTDGGDGVLESSDDSSSEGEEDDGMDVDASAQPSGQGRKKGKNKANIPTVKPLPPVPLRKLRATGRTVHAIFLDSSSMQRFASHSRKPRPWPKSDEPSGLAHYTALYDSLRPLLDAVREHADSYAELFDYQQEKKRQKSQYKKGEAIVDEDGFTLVTRGGAYGKTLGGGMGVASKQFGADTEAVKKRKKHEKAGFYAFQVHEKRRKELVELKRKWEEDKAKVERLKASRTFRPY